MCEYMISWYGRRYCCESVNFQCKLERFPHYRKLWIIMRMVDKTRHQLIFTKKEPLLLFSVQSYCQPEAVQKMVSIHDYYMEEER